MEKIRHNRHRVRPQDMEASIHSTKTGEKRHISGLTEEPQTLVFTIVGQEDDRQDLHGQSSRDGYPIIFDSIRVRKDGLDGDREEKVTAEDRVEAYAKRIIHRGIDDIRMVKYYVKRGIHGRFYNPIGVIDNDPSHIKKRIGDTEWVFREVTKSSFEWYIQFLKTKNPANLRNAEREIV